MCIGSTQLGFFTVYIPLIKIVLNGGQDKTYTDEFKQQMVDLYNMGGYTHDRLCREYELTPSPSLDGCTNLETVDRLKKKNNRTSEENELIRLRKENKQLLMENDILKAAALIFGRKENQR